MAEEKKKHTLLKVVGGATAAAATAYSGFSYVIFRHAFDLNNSMIHKAKNLVHTDSEVEQWYEHSSKTDVFLNSYDGLKLHGLMIQNHEDSHLWMIFVHGTASYSKNMIPYMYEADHRGYNVLSIDQRGCGASEGKYTGLGWNEHYDLMMWINQMISFDKECLISLCGVNTGAATVINAVGDYLPKNVKCAVEDGSYSNMKEVINHKTKELSHIEAKPFFPAVDLLVQHFLHFSLNDVSLKKQLRECEIPMLFVHGSEDTTIPTSMVFDNYYACGCEKELYIVDGKGYNETYRDKYYFETLFEFIDKHMHA